MLSRTRTLNGVISSRDQFAWLVREAIIPLGAQFASRSGTTDGYALLSLETSGLTGSSIQVLNVSSTLADGKTGGLAATGTNYGSRTIQRPQHRAALCAHQDQRHDDDA